jgi:DNA polymerase-3 subunit gamma/tau
MAKKKNTSEEILDETAPAGAEYTVLARRYRPQQFSDLVGQEAVAQALINAIESNRVAHAYLFTGARGVGKTSAARILAKALNCVKGPTATPCDQCEICQAIIGGDDTDVLEIDGASNNSVDNIRDLRSNVQFRPSRSRYKIYIIDEVHMLSTSAFNALLKTLEEPPPHVKFIFATTEVQKVPITILSRCQRFDFGGISIPRILDRLKEIVTAEGMTADEEALEAVARRAGGSMRDAQSLLDQLLAFSGQNLTVDTVHQLLGTAHEERVIAVADAVLAKSTKQVLEIVNDIVNQGQQLGELLEQLIDYWRDLMIVNSAGLAGQTVSVSSKRRDTLEKHAKQGNLDTILAGMDILVTAKSRMQRSSHARALLEMALVRLCQLNELVPLSQIAQWLAREGVSPANKPAAVPAKPVAVTAASLEKKKLVPEPLDQSGTVSIPLTPESCQSIWQQVLLESGFSLQAELRKVKSVAIFGPNALDLAVPRRYNSPGSVFSDSARLGRVTDLLSRVVGQPCTIRVQWSDEPAESATNGAAKSPAAQAHGQQRQLRSELLQIPLVKKASDLLGAQIIRADEGFGVMATAPASDEPAENPPEDE